jgi:hypothetical protein
MKTRSALILLLLFTLSISCKDEEVSPQKAILGKWEFIGIGNGRIQAPAGINGIMNILKIASACTINLPLVR